MNDTSSNLQGYFITGSDTGVGKTWIGCQVIEQLKASGTTVKVRKPVESGCTETNTGTFESADGALLSRASGALEDIDTVTPYRFRAALAPDRAALLQNQRLSVADLERAVRYRLTRGDLVVAEGAGGFYSPLTHDGLNADLARQLKLPVIIVVENRLGAINQALLTLRAVKEESLRVTAVILNQVNRASDEDPDMDNLSDLQQRISEPVYYCHHGGKLPRLALQP